MPSYSLTAVNVGSFPLGESDKVLTLFSAERGLTRAVAKGARKPGTKIAGRADVLKVNKLLVASGRSLDIITQAETLESYSDLRDDLTRLSYALYYAELTSQFGQGLHDESQAFFAYLCEALKLQAQAEHDPSLLCLQFEMHLLDLLGYKPEIDFCVICRKTITDSSVSAFDHELGGIICASCFAAAHGKQRHLVSQETGTYLDEPIAPLSYKTHVTPLVWKGLVLANRGLTEGKHGHVQTSAHMVKASAAACKLVQTYIEHKAGRRMKALALLESHS
jgi:DNA repair protein RecO (recombination protein O)